MGKKKMGFAVRQLDRVLLLSTALVMLSVGQQALADGDSSKPLAPPPPPRVTTTGSVSVDMSALDSVPNRRLLLPGVGGATAPMTDAPIRLRPPPGVKPIAQAPIRLRPPPGVQPFTPRTPKAAEAPKAAETRMASVTPPAAQTAPVVKTELPKAESSKAEPPKPAAPAAKAPVAPAPKITAAPPAKAPAPAAAPTAPPKVAATVPAAPPPAQKQTQVASAPPTPASPAPGQPRSLLTPPPAQTAAAPPAGTAEPALTKTEEAKPGEPPKETTVAALPPPAKTPVDGPLTISFKVGGADVPTEATAGLKAIAARLAKDPTARLQLVAFASDPEKSISRSRRLSLERAVNVRKVMLGAGIESTRIDIRALGEQSGNGAPDRVDVITVKR